MSAAILRHHLDVFVSYEKDVVEFEETEKQMTRMKEELRRILNMSVNEIELSVCAANWSEQRQHHDGWELAQKSEAEMLKYRNCGKKSSTKSRNKLLELGAHACA